MAETKKKPEINWLLMIIFIAVLVGVVVWIVQSCSGHDFKAKNIEEFKAYFASPDVNKRWVIDSISGTTDQDNAATLWKIALHNQGSKEYIALNAIKGTDGYNEVSNLFNLNSKAGVTPEISKPTNWFSILTFALMGLIILSIGFSMFSMMRGGRKGMGGGFGPSIPGMDAGSSFRAGKSTVRYDDVAGIEEEKEELLEIVDFLKNPMKYKQMGLRTPRGVLLYGPPGTGKTLLAKATAGEAGVEFLEISGSSVSGIIAGSGAYKIRNLFKTAAKKAPCIVFIDEIDTIGRKRGMSINQSSDDQQTLNQLLTSMDGFQPLSGVVVMAATNRLQDLDDALLRPGRFDRQIQINPPDVLERQAIIKVHSRNKNLSKNVTVDEVARRTPGFTGAQIENVLNEAGLMAVRENKRVINLKQIEEAIERVIGGPAKKRRKRDKFTQQVIAYHEAGHAVISLALKGLDSVEKITIVQRGAAGGYVMTKNKDAYNFETKQDYLDDLVVACGGRAAEQIKFGENKITSGAYSDFRKVTQLSRAMVTKLGMSKLGIIQFESDGQQGFTKPYSDHLAELIDDEVNKIAKTAYLEALSVIKDNKKTFGLIAKALLISESLTQKQVQYIFTEQQIPEPILKLAKDIKPLALEGDGESVKVDEEVNVDNDERIIEPKTVPETEE